MIIQLDPIKHYLDEQLHDLAKKTQPNKPQLEIILVGDDFASKKYVAIKERLASKFGIQTHIKQFDQGIPADYIVEEISETEDSIDGRIIQLPLPVNYEDLIKLLSSEKDVDCLLADTIADMGILPPTIQAIDLTLQYMLSGVENIDINTQADLAGKNIAVIGRGKLVGQPLLDYLPSANPAKIISIDIDTPHPEILCKQADIVISATGKANLVNQSWLKDNTILIDAGTSESNGALSGDVDMRDIHKSTRLIPSPGGIGPLTVRCLFWNLHKLKINKHLQK